MRICFPFDGHTICVTVPELIPPFQNPPDPTGSWLSGEGISAETALGLQALATIMAAAKHLPTDHQQHIGQAIETSIGVFARKLPSFRWPPSGAGPDPASRH